MTASGQPPTARVEVERGSRWALLLPLLALVLAAVLLRDEWRARGPRITLRADDGHGLGPGDPLRHRGIEVGVVESIALAEGARGVVIGVRLERSAAGLARAGARFWIVRPVLGVEGARGLEALLGARSLAVLPGPPDGELCAEFVALEEPPLSELEEEGALEVVLECAERAGLARGAPLVYRGIQVGTIVSVGLAADARAVEARARVRAAFAELVRVDSRFYRTQGAELSLGLGGLELAVDSLQSLWLGGVALATPTHPGLRASTGQRFALAAEPEEEWLAWRPALALGSELLPGVAGLPDRSWSRLVWKDGRWFKRERERSGWLVRDARGWVGPADLLVPPEGAEAESVFLERDGRRHALAGPPPWSGELLARRPFEDEGAPLPAPLAARPLAEAEDLLLCGDPALAPIALGAEELERDGPAWRVGRTQALDERWHGAVALARADGKAVGILLVTEDSGRIAPWPAE